MAPNNVLDRITEESQKDGSFRNTTGNSAQLDGSDRNTRKDLHNRMGQIVTLEEALHNFWDGSYKNTRRGLHNRMGRNLTLEEALHNF